ncbi:MAG: gephyrin-like molybdotransferase Glp [Spirochaetaceae bacterium]
MISFHQALSIVESQEHRLETELVELSSAQGRFLCGAAVSTTDDPPFTKAAMDGFAVSSADTSTELRILETIAAGDVPRLEVVPGTCSRIMTGAMLPAGADKVHRVEYTEERDGRMIPTQAEPARNVITRGENLKAGESVLGPRVLAPQDIGVAASLGSARLDVVRMPRVGIIATGSELAEPGTEPGAGGIYNSNAYQLVAHARAAGCVPTYYGIAEDTEAALEEVLARAFAAEDIIILTGGVSKGEFDYVGGVLERAGVEVLFHGVAMKPGRPTLFGRRGDPAPDRPAVDARPTVGTQYVFGLPGNPVSAFVTFEVFVTALLYRLAGLKHRPQPVPATLAAAVDKRDAERTEFIPVRWNAGVVEPVRYGGSSHISALADTDALLMLDVGTTRLEKGARVDVRPIRT